MVAITLTLCVYSVFKHVYILYFDAYIYIIHIIIIYNSCRAAAAVKLCIHRRRYIKTYKLHYNNIFYIYIKTGDRKFVLKKIVGAFIIRISVIYAIHTILSRHEMHIIIYKLHDSVAVADRIIYINLYKFKLSILM